jgi:hypothetical protein
MRDKAMTLGPLIAIVAVLVALSATSCAPQDEPVPFDTAEIVRDVTKSLREGKLLASDFEQTEILAWHVAKDTGYWDPIPLKRDFYADTVLLWARTQTTAGAVCWVLVEASRPR